MIDGSKSEPPFCVRSWLKKIEKKIVCRKVLEKNCLQRCIDKKKVCRERFFIPPPPPSRKIINKNRNWSEINQSNRTIHGRKLARFSHAVYTRNENCQHVKFIVCLRLRGKERGGWGGGGGAEISRRLQIFVPWGLAGMI